MSNTRRIDNCWYRLEAWIGTNAFEGGFLTLIPSVRFRRRSANPETRCLKGHTVKGEPLGAGRKRGIP